MENALCGGEEGKGIETVNMGTIGHLQDETFRFVGTCVFEEKEVFVVDVSTMSNSIQIRFDDHMEGTRLRSSRGNRHKHI